MVGSEYPAFRIFLFEKIFSGKFSKTFRDFFENFSYAKRFFGCSFRKDFSGKNIQKEFLIRMSERKIEKDFFCRKGAEYPKRFFGKEYARRILDKNARKRVLHKDVRRDERERFFMQDGIFS